MAPVALLILGLTAGTYITWNVQYAGKIARTRSLAAQTTTARIQTALKARSVDSLTDSQQNTEMSFSRNRGNIDDKGVITVDLKK